MNLTELRKRFWQDNPQFKRVAIPVKNRSDMYTTCPQNRYNATIRSAWVEYVDYMARSGQITEKLAESVTLK